VKRATKGGNLFAISVVILNTIPLHSESRAVFFSPRERKQSSRISSLREVIRGVIPDE